MYISYVENGKNMNIKNILSIYIIAKRMYRIHFSGIKRKVWRIWNNESFMRTVMSAEGVRNDRMCDMYSSSIFVHSNGCYYWVGFAQCELQMYASSFDAWVWSLELLKQNLEFKLYVGCWYDQICLYEDEETFAMQQSFFLCFDFQHIQEFYLS